MRGTALSGSNMENFELATQSVHVEDGPRSGPVVDSPRQLWSVAGYLAMVMEGVFGLETDGRVAPKIPVELVPMLFGERDAIALDLGTRRIVLRRPARMDGNLLVAGPVTVHGTKTTVQLVARNVPTAALVRDGERTSPSTPEAPQSVQVDRGWQVALPARARLYVDGRVMAHSGATPLSVPLPAKDTEQCFSATTIDASGIESLHSPTRCVGPGVALSGDWPRAWTAPRDGRYRVRLQYANDHGPINTGITAAVKRLRLECDGAPPQAGPIVMPHNSGTTPSTAWTFTARAGVPCRFTLDEGFNMSDLAHFRLYTGGQGGEAGPLNDAAIGSLDITPAR
jgi:hypothetical protein